LRVLEGDVRPERLVVFDTESLRLAGGDGESQAFALAYAQVYTLDDRIYRRSTWSYPWFTSPHSLWGFIDTWAGLCRGSTYCYAHQLAHDLSVTGGLSELDGLGWRVVMFAVMPDRGCWVKLRKGRSLLVLADSLSIFGAGLDQLARDLGRTRVPLPDSAWPADYEARCRDDVDLLSTALLEYLEWLEVEGAGSLAVTGPGQAMNLYRRRFLPPRTIVAHDIGDVLEVEREAAWAGRAEAWRLGRQDGTIYEWDFELSYPSIAREAVPVRLARPLVEPSWGEWDALRPRFALLARCEIETELPLVPTRVEGRGIIWPVGRFETTLWDVEVELCRQFGAKITLRDGFAYHRACVLEPWSCWITEQVESASAPLVRRVAKLWARTLIGRFALSYPRWELLMDDALPHLGDRFVGVMAHVDMDTPQPEGEGSHWLQVGGQVWEQSGNEESDSSVPSITSWITAAARARLWCTMVKAGLSSVIYIDTDSVMVDQAGHRRLIQARIPGLRVKGEHEGLEVWGMRQLVIGGRPRASGLSTKAHRLSDERWGVEVWEGLTSALGGGGVRVVGGEWTMRRGDRRRVALGDGATGAVTV
jgi:hypothetical protein